MIELANYILDEFTTSLENNYDKELNRLIGISLIFVSFIYFILFFLIKFLLLNHPIIRELLWVGSIVFLLAIFYKILDFVILRKKIRYSNLETKIIGDKDLHNTISKVQISKKRFKTRIDGRNEIFWEAPSRIITIYVDTIWRYIEKKECSIERFAEEINNVFLLELVCSILNERNPFWHKECKICRPANFSLFVSTKNLREFKRFSENFKNKGLLYLKTVSWIFLLFSFIIFFGFSISIPFQSCPKEYFIKNFPYYYLIFLICFISSFFISKIETILKTRKTKPFLEYLQHTQLIN